MGSQRIQMNVEALVGKRVQGLQEYAPEPLDQIARRLGLPVGQIIKLDANENPYGPTQHTRDVIDGYDQYHRYPDPISRRLRRALGEWLDVDPETIIVGNGSDELIDLVLRVFRPDPDGGGAQAGARGGIGQVINCPPTFGMYQFYGVTNDMQVIDLPRDADFGLDVAAIERLCEQDSQPRVLFLTSPNNPDGQLLAAETLQRLLTLPLIIVLDEAYVDFCSESRVGWVADRDNLIVLRTFSKWAGLAGLRVGYGVFPKVLMTALWRLKSPYNVNGLAQAAAQATLEDVDTARANVDSIIEERGRLLAKLRKISFLQVYESQANFILCRVQGITVEAVRSAMERRGIILRYFGRDGLQDCIRITVGTPMQDESLLVVLRELDAQGGTTDDHSR